MRFSDGVKRREEETKKRLFDEIIAAAERDNVRDISHTDGETAVIRQQNTEDSIMRDKEGKARIRSSKGSVMAAACAVLVIGGGIFAAGHMNGGSKGVSPAASGTAYTTDDEDSTADITEEDSKAEEDISSESEISVPKAEEDAYWREEMDEDSLKLIDASDFVGLVQIVNIQTEDIDGVEYTDYLCSLTDENGNGGVIFKYTEDSMPNRLSIMQIKQGEQLLKTGDKIFVCAAKGVQSTSGVFSLELADGTAIFKWSKDACRYQNIYKPGHYISDISEGIVGEYSCGQYEAVVETYFKTMLCTTDDDYSYQRVKDWCDFEGLPCVEVIGSGQDFPEGMVTGYTWPSDAGVGEYSDGVVVMISDGLSYTGEYDTDAENQAAIDLNVHDKGVVTKEFADYDMELGGLFYEPDDNCYGIVIDVTNKDGSAFSHDDWIDNHMDLVYGDVTPIMDMTESSLMESGLSWLTEDEGDRIMRVCCIFHAEKPLSEVASDVPVTLKVLTVRQGDVEEDGEFEVTFNIDINDIKE